MNPRQEKDAPVYGSDVIRAFKNDFTIVIVNKGAPNLEVSNENRIY
jgi:hypothetical protein